MVIRSAEIKFSTLPISFNLGDEKLKSLSVTLGARDRSSNAQFSVIDNDLALSDILYTWSRENGGIKIPEELRGKEASTGSTAPKPGTNPGGTTTNGAKLEGLENEPVEVSAFMDVIAYCEGTYPDGYNIMFTGATFSDFSDHPRQIQGGGDLSSDAAGRYQFLSTTWDSVAASVGVTDFSPKSQNICGWQLAKNRGATAEGIASDPVAQLKICAEEWASLPGSPYGQPTKSEEECKQKYDEYLAARKAEESSEPTPKEPNEEGTDNKDLEILDEVGQFNYYYSIQLSNETKSFLDLISYGVGTYELGDQSYFNDPSNSEPLENLDTYPDRTSGRYSITPEAFNQYLEDKDQENTFTANKQDEIAIYIYTEYISSDASQKISGDINGAIVDISEYWEVFADEDRLTEFIEFYNSRLEYHSSQNEEGEPATPGETATVSNVGEKVVITVRTENDTHTYNYILVDDQIKLSECVLSFNVQSVRYTLNNTENDQVLEDVNAVETAEIIAAKNDIEVTDNVNPNESLINQNTNPNTSLPNRNQSTLPLPDNTSRNIGQGLNPNNQVSPDNPVSIGGVGQGLQIGNGTNINQIPNTGIGTGLIEPINVDGQGKTDLEVINETADDQGIVVSDDTTTGGIKIDLERKGSAKRLVILEIIDIEFQDKGVVNEEPLYPVTITSITNDVLLGLLPEEDVTLDNAYSFIPASMKDDVWVVMSISHDISREISTLELLKYIPVEEEVIEGGTTTGGGKLSADEIYDLRVNSVVKLGSATAWVVSEDGYLMTAAHMAGSSDVTFKDGSTYTATQVATDNATDIMLIKIEASGLTPIPIAPDTSIYPPGGSETGIHVIGFPGKVDGGGQHEWYMKSGSVKEIAENGHKSLTSGKVVVVDDKTNNFADPGDSGGPWLDDYGFAVALTSGGDASGPGTGDEAWGAAIEEIIKMLQSNDVNYTTGNRSATTSGGGSVSDRTGGVYPGWVSPSDGVLTSGFGPRTAPTSGASSNHQGVDIAAGQGAAIYAAADGVVVDRDDNTNGSGYGNYLVIHHENDSLWTLYGHCESLLVENGATVKAGEKIATEDNTGTSTGSHLHFGVAKGVTGSNIWSGTFVDPLGYIPTPTSSYDYYSLRVKYGKSYSLGSFNDTSLIGVCKLGQQIDNTL